MGGGGDGGYGAKQEKIEADKARARAELNRMFGVYTPGANVVADPASFGVDGGASWGGGGSGEPDTSSSFDEAGYQAAQNTANTGNAAMEAEAAKNKAARDALYGGIRTNAYDAGKRRLDDQRDVAARDTKFELFARGLNAGSTDIDQNALLGRTYGNGILDLGAKADGVATDARTNDEQTRLGLLQSIDNGMDQGSALSSALVQMRNNSDRASSAAQGTALGDLFGTGGFLYEQGRRAQGTQAGNDWWSNNYPTRSRSSRGAATGIITPT